VCFAHVDCAFVCFLYRVVAEWVYFDTAETWVDARATCEAQSGKLVTILSEEQNTRLANFVLGKDSSAGLVWTGANDLNEEV